MPRSAAPHQNCQRGVVVASKEIVKRLLCAVLIASNVCVPIAQAGSNSTSLCGAAGYTLGFVNGVWNTYADAVGGLVAPSKIIPSTYNSLTVSPEVFYNHTGCGGSGTRCLQDLAVDSIHIAMDFMTAYTEAIHSDAGVSYQPELPIGHFGKVRSCCMFSHGAG